MLLAYRSPSRNGGGRSFGAVIWSIEKIFRASGSSGYHGIYLPSYCSCKLMFVVLPACLPVTFLYCLLPEGNADDVGSVVRSG